MTVSTEVQSVRGETLSGRVRLIITQPRRCSRCDNRVQAGKAMWGWWTLSGFSVALCQECHDLLEQRLQERLS